MSTSESDQDGAPRVVDATPEDFDAILARGLDALVVLYMWGPNCPNCEVFSARLPHFLRALVGTNVLFVKVDVYAYPELARRYGVFGIPHFLLFREGRRLGRMSEFRGDAFFTQVIREQLATLQRPPSA
jgi:thioredoxin-like negative regulator of GroEL